jgi:hypothetical protein
MKATERARLIGNLEAERDRLYQDIESGTCDLKRLLSGSVSRLRDRVQALEEQIASGRHADEKRAAGG